MTEDSEPCCEIGIDCPPGEPRPGALFPKVLSKSGLRVSDFEITGKLYGAWTWKLKPSTEKRVIFLGKRRLFYRRLASLVAQNVIRGAILNPELAD
jgi:hypothetical protein